MSSNSQVELYTNTIDEYHSSLLVFQPGSRDPQLRKSPYVSHGSADNALCVRILGKYLCDDPRVASRMRIGDGRTNGDLSISMNFNITSGHKFDDVSLLSFPFPFFFLSRNFKKKIQFFPPRKFFTRRCENIHQTRKREEGATSVTLRWRGKFLSRPRSCPDAGGGEFQRSRRNNPLCIASTLLRTARY